MKHRLVLTIIAKERYIFAEVHILEMIGDKTAVATLDALAKIFDSVVFRHLFDDPAFGAFDKCCHHIYLRRTGDLSTDAGQGLAGVKFG